MKTVVLATTSKYKISLFEKLGITFQAKAHQLDERSLSENLTPKKLAATLALKKAQSLNMNDELIIAADQIAELSGEVLHKPGNDQSCFQQLKKMSGKTHYLHTAIAIVGNNINKQYLETVTLTMKNLSDQEIQDYVRKDRPYDCAGGYKIEENGEALFDKMEYQDFNSIIGLPTTQLQKILTELGY